MCTVDVVLNSKCFYNKMFDYNTETNSVQVYIYAIDTKRLSDFVDYWLSFTFAYHSAKFFNLHCVQD